MSRDKCGGVGSLHIYFNVLAHLGAKGSGGGQPILSICHGGSTSIKIYGAIKKRNEGSKTHKACKNLPFYMLLGTISGLKSE